MYHSFMEGERIYLRGIEKKDLEGAFFQWANDKEVTRYLFMGAVPNILENLNDWFDAMRKSNEDIVFMVIDRENDREIGFCGFHRILWMHRHAEYRVFLGDKDYWDKAYGREIMKVMFRYGFEILNFNKIWLGVTASHKRAVQSYLKGGMVQEGVLRQEVYRNSVYHDAVRMSMLRDEYYDGFKNKWDKEIPNVFEEK